MLHKNPQNSIEENFEQGYISVKSGKLFYNKYGSGSPIVILHGGPGLDHTYLLPQMLELAKNYTLIFYDQRGSGKSLDTPMTSRYINIEQFTQDLEELRNHWEFDKIILAGHSWGGLLAMKYAIDYPQHVSHLMLWNTAPADYKGGEAFVKESGSRMKKLMATNVYALFDYEKFTKLRNADANELYRNLFATYFYDYNKVSELNLHFDVRSTKSGFKVMTEISKNFWCSKDINLFPKLKKLDIPTLIIHGEQDVVPLWTAKDTAKAISKSKIIVLEKCGHFAYIEQPEKFFTGVREFLNDDE